MTKNSGLITRSITWKYVLALGLLAILAVANYLLLRTQILSSQVTTAILINGGQQRTLLHRAAWLAERLVFAPDEPTRKQLRAELISTLEPLEATHFELMHPRPALFAPPPQIRAVYEDVPWLLDSEMRNYVQHLRSLTEAPDEELNYSNAHFKYVRNPQTIDKIIEGLNAVVEAFVQQRNSKTAELQLLAVWSLTSTLIVLLFDGWLVFRPMVRQVHEGMEQLNAWNEMLDKRVLDRTAESERRAEQLALSEAALRDSEALYRSLVNHLPMCVLRKDEQGRFTFANDKYCKWMELSLDQIVGRTDANWYPPHLATKYQAEDQQVMQTQQVLQQVEPHITPNGGEKFVEVIKAPLRDAQSHVIGTQTVFWDVTERMEQEQRTRHGERLAAIGQMIAGVAHESRNALQQMQACAQLLAWELEHDTTKRELVADIQTAQDRLHRMFDNLRGYASPLKLNLRPCSIAQLVFQAWESLANLRSHCEATLVDLSVDKSLQCFGDPFHLEQVFRNILENAIAACGQHANIELEYQELLQADQSVLLIIIRDNGPGLTQEQQERIFEPFFTTKSQGTGLGMAIVRQIIEGHRGKIAAKSATTGGMEVEIRLPHPNHWIIANSKFAEELDV